MYKFPRALGAWLQGGINIYLVEWIFFWLTHEHIQQSFLGVVQHAEDRVVIECMCYDAPTPTIISVSDCFCTNVMPKCYIIYTREDQQLVAQVAVHP